MRHAITAAAITVLCAAGAVGAAPADAQVPDSVVMADHNDPALVQAIERAREMLPYFWDAVEARAPGDESLAVKVGFEIPDDQGGLEYMWVEVAAHHDDLVEGSLNSIPLYIPELVQGQPVSVADDRIIDWGIIRDGRLIGHYTTRVLLEDMDAKEAAPIRAMLGEAP